MINEMRLITVKKILQTIIYLPHFISAVIAASLVTTFLSPDYGLINDVIRMFGGQPKYFLIEKSYFRTIVILTYIWKGTGWGTIVYLAALAGVDGEVLEASIIDGASRIQRIIYINIPSIMSVVVIMFILAVGSIISSDFEMILNLYNPLVYEVGDVLDTYIYRIGLQSQGRNMFSASTAANMFKSVISFVLIILTNKAASKLSEGEMRIW
ncbi:MAG: ABC transporter permease subunit [Treponema sp.]|nr:ABC transporter permease subunit [Treponema sp.]